MKKTLLVSLFACVGLRAVAGTVGLWTFEGGTVGATAGAIVNQANPGVLDGSTVAYGSGPLPVYSADIPGASLYTSFADTVADVNAGSLQFTGTRNSNGYVSIADDGNLTRPANVTVECFFKANSGGAWHSLITKAIPADAKKMSWALRIDGSDYLFATISSASGANVVLSPSVKVVDGQWHHVALTIDGTTGAAILYLDYTPIKTATVPVPLYYAAAPIAIGAHPYNTQCYSGSIDSVRVSDTALTPSQFLTPLKGLSGAFAYLSANGEAGAAPTYLLNQANPDRNAIRYIRAGGTVPAFSNDVPGTIVYAGFLGTEFANPDAGSVFFSGSIINSGVGTGFAVPDADGEFTSGDFTVEGFVRVPPTKRLALGSSSTQVLFRKQNASNVCFAVSINSSGGVQSTCTLSNNSASTVSSSFSIDDDRWHHVALTYTADTRTQRLYVDGSLISTADLALPLFTEGTDKNIYLGVSTAGLGLYGWMDEMRLTQAALTPADFLTTVRLPTPPLIGAYWPLDGEPETTVGTVTNNLSASLSGYGLATTTSGTPPVYNAETVAETLYDGADGAVWTAANRSSVSFNKISGTAGSHIRIPDPFDLSTSDGTTTNLTVELFFRSRSQSGGVWQNLIRKQNAGGNSWGLLLNNTGILSVSIARAGSSTTLSSFPSTIRYDDGKWHHAAFTYDGATRRAALYVDYRSVASSIFAEPILFDGRDIQIGGRGSDYPLDGLIDEVRITPATLTAEQFLTTTRTPDRTIIHWTFDDGLPSGASPYIVPGTELAYNLLCESTRPVYTNDAAKSPVHRRIYDGSNGDFVHLNDTALALQNSKLSCPDNPILRAATNVTVEFFLKADTGSNHNTGIIRKNYDTANNPTWSLSTVTNNGILRLNSRFAGTDGGAYTNNNQTYSVDYRLDDGKWHHCAMTYDSSISTAVFYIDYVERGRRTVTGTLMTGPGELAIGTSGNSFFQGLIDEIRISNVLLTPDQFLRAYAPGGTRIIFR